MAKQTGPLQIIGTVDQITFYKTAESGFLARRKSNLDAKRVKKDPAFAESRKASAEFARASTAAKLLRQTMQRAGHELADTRIISRLTGKLTGIISTDTMHEKGERQFDDADLLGLIGFEWNKHQTFASLCKVTPAFRVDRAGGVVEVAIPALSAGNFNAPKGATHYELVFQGALCRFAGNRATQLADTTGWRRLDSYVRAQTLMDALPNIEGQRMLLGLGVRFGAEISGELRPLSDNHSTAFVIGAVE